jgi:hypothetical protein
LFEDDKEAGLRFQDWVGDRLLTDHGLAITFYCSVINQLGVGESRQGIEVKYDRRFRDTGNLFIEIEHRGVPSGVYREDNCWLWVQGDYQGAYVFSRKQLQWLERLASCKTITTETGTTGYLLPLKDAARWSILTLAAST